MAKPIQSPKAGIKEYEPYIRTREPAERGSTTPGLAMEKFSQPAALKNWSQHDPCHALKNWDSAIKCIRNTSQPSIISKTEREVKNKRGRQDCKRRKQKTFIQWAKDKLKRHKNQERKAEHSKNAWSQSTKGNSYNQQVQHQRKTNESITLSC